MEKLFDPEVKFFDTTVTTSTSLLGGTFCLSLMGGGTGVSQRVGEKIKAKELQSRMSLTAGSATLQSDHRIIIFSDSDNQGALPSVADVLVSADVEAQYTWTNSRSIDGEPRFRILYDKTFMMDPNTGASSTFFAAPKIPINREMVFTGSGSGQGQQSRNSLYLLVLSDSVVCTLTSTHRLLYTDD